MYLIMSSHLYLTLCILLLKWKKRNAFTVNSTIKLVFLLRTEINLITEHLYSFSVVSIKKTCAWVSK